MALLNRVTPGQRPPEEARERVGCNGHPARFYVLSAWDRKVARRAAAIAALVALLALAVVAATDEGAPWSQRVGMVAALLPIAGSIGAIAAIRIAERRGELCALAAIGVDPVRAVRGAVLGGVVLGLIGPLL